MNTKDSHVFISYSWRDKRFVERLCMSLKDSGVPIWIDKVEMKAGDSIQGRVEAAITNAEYVVVVLSPHSVNSTWVTEELRLAMTRQREEKLRLVIPILYKDCLIPPFLRDRLCVDFRKSKPFSTNFQMLLAALDDGHRATRGLEEENFPTMPTFVESLASADGLKDDEWMTVFQSLPLVQILAKAISLNAFAGTIKTEILIALTMTSHAGGGITFNNLCALLGFLSDMQKRNLTNPELLRLVKEIVELASKESTYRWFALSFLIRRLVAVHSRRTKLDLLPDIFPTAGFDPLADRLVAEFFETDDSSGGGLAELWKEASVYYREELIQYLIRVSEWKKPVRIPEDIASQSDAIRMKRSFKPYWQSIQGRQVEASLALDELVIPSDHVKPETILSSIETASRAMPNIDRTGVDALINLVTGDSVDRSSVMLQHLISCAESSPLHTLMDLHQSWPWSR